MIKCPKCQKDDHLILERPSWNRDIASSSGDVDIDCTCTKCRVSFVVEVTFKKVVKTRDIVEDYDYPY